MYLSQSSDGTHFSPARKLGEGTWKLNACPMDGGGIAISANGPVTGWRREHSLFLDRPGEPEESIGEGVDMAIAAGKSGTYAIWSTPAGLELHVPGEREPRALGIKGSFPGHRRSAGRRRDRGLGTGGREPSANGEIVGTICIWTARGIGEIAKRIFWIATEPAPPDTTR